MLKEEIRKEREEADEIGLDDGLLEGTIHRVISMLIIDNFCLISFPLPIAIAQLK